jgi:hypothetical protein
MMRGIPWTLIMTRALTSLDMKGVRNGDQNHLMQPNSLY